MKNLKVFNFILLSISMFNPFFVQAKEVVDLATIVDLNTLKSEINDRKRKIQTVLDVEEGYLQKQTVIPNLCFHVGLAESYGLNEQILENYLDVNREGTFKIGNKTLSWSELMDFWQIARDNNAVSYCGGGFPGVEGNREWLKQFYGNILKNIEKLLVQF